MSFLIRKRVGQRCKRSGGLKELIHFSVHPRKKYAYPIEVKVGSTIVKPKQQARYLGVIFDQKLTWKQHVQHVKEKVQSRISLLRFLSQSTPESNSRIMLNLFKALVRPLLTYGSSVLLKADDKIWKTLQIEQNKAIRAARGVPSYTSTHYIHSESKLKRLKDYCTELTQRALIRAKNFEDNVSIENLTILLN